MSHHSAVGDQRKYQQKGSEPTVQLCHWAKLVTVMLVLFEEAFIKQLWMAGPSFILQAEEQVPEVDSGDALSHKLPGASSTWASGLGGAWPRALECKTVQTQGRYLVDRFCANLKQFFKKKHNPSWKRSRIPHLCTCTPNRRVHFPFFPRADCCQCR